MSKLTLSVDADVIARAKRYAAQRGISVSAMVQTYLSAVATPNSAAGCDTPVLRSVRGVLRNAGLEDYRKHLAAKYR